MAITVNSTYIHIHMWHPHGRRKPRVAVPGKLGCLESRCEVHGLERYEVRVVGGRPTNGLASVVDDDVQSMVALAHEVTPPLEHSQVPKVEAVDVQPCAPNVRVAFRGESSRGVSDETGRGDHHGSAPQQLQGDAVADFDARARDDAHHAFHVRPLLAFAPVELRARRAQIGVEEVQRLKGSFAGVALHCVVQRDSLRAAAAAAAAAAAGILSTVLHIVLRL